MGIEGKTNIFKKNYIVLFIFAISAFIIFFNSINSSFHFDDRVNIYENPNVTINELSFSTLKKAASTSISGLRPVSYITFALNYYFSKTNTTPYHVVNIIIHIINAFLIYIIILHLFRYTQIDDEKKRESIRLSAFLTALFWLLTPLNSQAVVYIVQRMTLLATFFFLLAFYAYLMSKEKNKVLYLTLTGIFYLLSLWSKQNGVVFPIVIIMYELVYVKKGDIKNITKQEKLFFMSLFLILTVTVLFYGTKNYNDVISSYSARDFNLYERLLTQPRVLMFYLSLIILPLPGRLSITHHVVKSTSLVSPMTTLFSFAFLIFLFVIAIVRVKKSPYLSFAILWFFITMLVESSVLPLEMAYDHRMYLPCIFLFGAVVDFAIKRFYDTNKIPVLAISLVIAILFGSLNVAKGRVWENELTLWEFTSKKYPLDSRAHYNLGSEYRRLGDLERAEKGFLLATKHDPEHFLALNNLGIIYDMRGEFQKALDYYNKALKAKPDLHMAAYNLAAIHKDLGNIDESTKFYNIFISIKPEYYDAYFKLASNYYIQKDYEKALEVLQKIVNSSASENEKARARNEMRTVTNIIKSNTEK